MPKRVNPHHENRRFINYEYRKMNSKPKGDNFVRSYDEGTHYYGRLEERVREAIRKEFDYWKNGELFETENGPELHYRETTIREDLAMEDSKFPHNSWAKKARVPSLKRSNREWENFYNTFPEIGVKAATGKYRFFHGAKLKYIPMFKRILDEEWSENAKQIKR